MKTYMKTAGLALTVPLVLMACETDNNGEGGENGENNNLLNNENNDESTASEEVDELAGDYGLTVSTDEAEEMSDEQGKEAEDVSLDELEEAFEVISTAQDTERLEFIESPEQGEMEESGSATGNYQAPGVETDEISAVQVSFQYELEGDLEDEERYPTFGDVSDVEPAMEEEGIMRWNTDNVEVDTAGAGTVAEIFVTGSWDLLGEYEGTEVALSEPDEWMVEFSTDVFMGIEEQEG
ncbi:hypothetical protein K8O68_16525 [Salipaludibacillus sp. CUR1]|uniref:hypothetical protein n=1 Tax=Salipaludibacillus sp. CUR1 TaxID=2820003 RepID=UPI001E65ACA7|nr:hypothetical protein [Salipaludibacillus sp. CUR1]MCE7793995.1 hypothetical protein [Salipaludibacillus sp. CUR1]